MRRETALKIIGLLRDDLDSGYTILGISKKLQIGYRPAYNHITELEKEKIILVETVGRAKKCSLNLSSTKCQHLLQELALEQKENLYKEYPKLKYILESILQKMSTKIAAQLHSIILFGSYAKKRATKGSDIDLLFIISDISDKDVRGIIQTECASYMLSHTVPVSPLLTDFKELSKMLESKDVNVGKEVRNHGVPVYGSQQFWRIIAWQE